MPERIAARVAVENTIYHFDKAFDYLIPEELAESAKPGCRALIPFGAANGKRQGMILELCPLLADTDKLKPIIAVLDKAPLLSNEALLLVHWLKDHYFCTLYDAVKLLLPIGINYKIRTEYSLKNSFPSLPLDEIQKQVIQYLSKKKIPVERSKLINALALTDDCKVLEQLCELNVLKKSTGAVRQVSDATQKMVRLTELIELPKLTPKQKSVHQVLNDVGSASLKELCYFAGATPAVVHTLVAKGIAQYYECEIYRNPYEHIRATEAFEEIVLSDEQQAAYNNLYAQYQSGTGGISLLFGVTGSGKTSVFMRLIDRVNAEGRGVIVMVPEISLTPQTISLFHKRYGKGVAVFHSGLTMAERLDEWKRVNEGEALIAVGTRSAVFAPFHDIGLIIMDEEQEYTYKSESAPRYHAREIAKYRCAYHKGLLVLSSATPSIESYYLAQYGRYSLNTITTRYGSAKLPDVKIVDMNQELESGNNTIFSTALLDAIKNNTENHKQSIVLLNRRGYNTFVTCKSCGQVVTCPNCSISLTYHAVNHRLMCHYCGYSVPFTKECPQCHEDKVHYTGFGTQRAEEQLHELLPQVRILRLDTDSTLTRFAYEKKMEQYAAGEYDVIIGTQMVAKGLDFENVTLVGVLTADQALYGEDFRSYERAFDLLTQVVGRSGRGKYSGLAIIQTFTPENEVIRLASEQDYVQFYEGEIAVRKALLYPPFSDICVIGFVGASETKVQKASRFFFSLLSQIAKNEYPGQPLRVLNPSPALINKVSNKYRYKLIIKCRNSLIFREMISKLLIQFSSDRSFTSVTAFVDVNPDSIL